MEVCFDVLMLGSPLAAASELPEPWRSAVGDAGRASGDASGSGCSAGLPLSLPS